ncbi:hypothetical protein FJZ26_00650 [Candidatus Parvarchaeota archaeon]|nr:hypothetical protein [Candidatus Parvarchaeota archaeon]
MKSTMLQYEGSVELAVERLLQLGVFKSKADIFRLGALELASKYGLVKSKEDVIEEMMLKDAQGALHKLKSGKARLHKISSI